MVRSDVRRLLSGILVLGTLLAPLFALPPERDFSGNWILSYERSNLRALGAEPEGLLKVTQDDRAVHIDADVAAAEASWSYYLNGRESRYTAASEERNSVVKWEGAALLVNTLVAGTPGYAVMDRWRLSADRATLTIARQIVRPAGQVEGTLVYRRAGSRSDAPPAHSGNSIQPAPVLVPRPPAAPASPDVLTVAAGTRVLLELENSLNPAEAHEGDRVYLRVAFPVSVEDRVAIPRGAEVIGRITEVKNARGKNDRYIRFDTLTLPDGTTRDLRARPEGGAEGRIGGGANGSGDARRVATGAGVGASVGGLAGAAAGHAGAGMGAGGLAGAAAGLAGVFSRKRPDVTVPKGTTVEMVLQQEVRF
jgi:hypothetical protein